MRKDGLIGPLSEHQRVRILKDSPAYAAPWKSGASAALVTITKDPDSTEVS
jgi:hypothetical protein